MISQLSTIIVQRAVDRCDPTLPLDISILNGPSQLLGALTQHKKKKRENVEVKVLEWLFTRLQPQNTIQQKAEDLAELMCKARTRVMQISGKEPGTIYLPIKKEELEWYLQNSHPLQVSLLSEAQKINVSSLKAPVLKWLSQ